MARRFYPAVITRDAGDGPDDGFGVVFPGFPGSVPGGDTIQQAAAMAAEALSGHIEAMVRDNDPVPEPSDPAPRDRTRPRGACPCRKADRHELGENQRPHRPRAEAGGGRASGTAGGPNLAGY